MARLTPVNYNMQVLNPLQTAMAGYQAGFGQFQQLDDVRRQREADRMAAELHDAKMAEYERATAAAQAAQLEQAAFYEGFADGTHTPESLRRFRMSQNEVIREIAGEELASLTEEGRRSQFDRRAGLAVAFQRDPEAAITMLEEEREAARNAGDQDTVNIIDGLLPVVRNDPAAGDAVAYQLAMMVGTDEEMDRLDSLLAFGEEEKPPEGFRTLQARAAAAGLQPGTPEYQEFMERGGAERGPLVQVSTAPESTGYAVGEYAKVAGREIAAVHSDLSKAGYQAGRRTAQIDQLQDLLDAVGDDTGTLAGFKQLVLEKTGFEIEGADKIQAAEALISQLVPQQRPPGSGPMSDADLELFKRSLPKIMGTAEGNRQIIETMKEIAAYDMEVGRIARRAMYGEISPQEADRQIAEVYNPLAKLRSVEDLAADL